MKKTIYRPLLLIVNLIGIIILTSSCVRDGIEDCPPKAQVEVAFDYSYTGITPSGTTIIFYPKSNTPNGEKVSISTHGSKQTVSLTPGEYSVLVLNESFGDFSNIKFRGTEDYGKVEAYAIPVDNSGKASSYPSYHSPEMLVVDTLSTFTAAPGTSKVFTLRRRVAGVKVIIHIKDIQYVRTATGSISGFSEGQLLASHRNNTNGVTHNVEHVKLSYYDANKADGILTGTFHTFGLNPDKNAKYRLAFDALLIDGKTTYHKEFDITDSIETNHDDYGITIDIELGTQENPFIEIPKVKAEEGTAPFDPDVDDWEEDEDIDIPLK